MDTNKKLLFCALITTMAVGAFVLTLDSKGFSVAMELLVGKASHGDANEQSQGKASGSAVGEVKPQSEGEQVPYVKPGHLPSWAAEWDYQDGLTVEERTIVVSSWVASRKAGSLEQQKAYLNSYDIPALEDLAEAGDTMAMRLLAIYYNNPNSYASMSPLVAPGSAEPDLDKSLHYIELGIVLGKSRMVNLLSRLAQGGYDFSKLHGEESSPFIDKLAALKAASFQGDDMPLYTYGHTEMSVGRVKLSEEEWAEVSRRGKKIHRYFEEKRVALGYGPFESDRPKTIERYQALWTMLSKQVMPFDETDHKGVRNPFIYAKDLSKQ